MSENFNIDEQGHYQWRDGSGEQQWQQQYSGAGQDQAGYGYENYPQQQQQSFDGGYGSGATSAGGDLQFQSFSYTSGTPQDSGSGIGCHPDGGDQFGAPPRAGAAPYSGQIFTPAPLQASRQDPRHGGADDGTGYEDEPPLLEELGVNFDHIKKKTLAVLNPLMQTHTEILEDTDLAGPLVFCLLFGASLLLVGKVHFSYIYGIGALGCVSIYSLLNLMSMAGVSLAATMSILGYCLLPMVLLSFSSVLMSLQGLAGTLLALATILWCSVSASKLFVSTLKMENQQPLVAYPCALVYGVFALLTIF